MGSEFSNTNITEAKSFFETPFKLMAEENYLVQIFGMDEITHVFKDFSYLRRQSQ